MMARAPPATQRASNPIFAAYCTATMPPGSAALLLHSGKMETET